MKKNIALILSVVMALSLAACGEKKDENVTTATVAAESVAAVETAAPETTVAETVAETETAATETAAEESAVMSYADFVAADLDSPVCVETYVQAKQSWWDNKGTFYTQNEEGAYFLYEMGCTEDEYNQLTPGTKIRVNGFKSEWAGEVEIIDATFEILEGNFVAKAEDVTALLGTDELAEKQNQFVSFTDMTVEAVEFKNEQPGDDIYVTLSKDGNNYAFCLEYYLNGSDEEFYNLVSGLEQGATVDVEGFLYWYEGPNAHITSVTVK